MPELPEVETTRRGITPLIQDRLLTRVEVREPRLRWPVTDHLDKILRGQRLGSVGRRGKYLLLTFDHGTLIVHLGMSGSLRVLPAHTEPAKHDHLDLVFGQHCLRLHDPRRFGAVLWTDAEVMQHQLLRHLGPEPLGPDFDGDWLHRAASKRRTAVKNLIMDGRVVVGVGNIYANESLFMAGIRPDRACNRISRERYGRLAQCIRRVLTAAIAQGGTTLQDFQQADGKPGYFAQELQVYGRTDKACANCGRNIREKTIGQRASYYCAHCQR